MQPPPGQPAPPPWVAPGAPRPRRRTGLIVALIVLPVVLVVAAVGVGAYLYLGRGPSVPDGWATAGFVIDSDSSTPGEEARDRVGRWLVAVTGGGARYEVRPGGVRVGVPPGRSDRLDRLRSRLPLRTDMSMVPVRTMDSAGASGSASPGARPTETGGTWLTSLDGRTRYLLSPTSGRTSVTGRHVGSADYVDDTNGGGWKVTVSLTDAGGKRFAHLTAGMVGEQLAIVVAGVVVAAPTVQSAITGGEVEIAGGFTEAQASGIAAACLLGRDPVRVRSGDPG